MSIIPSLRASTSRACSSSFSVLPHHHARLSARAYATAVAKAKPKPAAAALPEVMTVQEMDRHRENAALAQRAIAMKAKRYGHQVSTLVDMQQIQIPVIEPITYKDFEKRWIWAGIPQAIYQHWQDLAQTPGFFAKMTMFGPLGYRETGIAQFVPRGFWSLWYSGRDRFLWLVQWYQQHGLTQSTLDHCRNEGLMLMTPYNERPAVGWREQVRRFFALGHTYRDWDPSMRELLNIYITYHQAQASRDVKTVAKTSVGKMRANGLKIAQSGAKMTWELVEEPALPVIRWARHFPLPDQEGAAQNRQIVQICCSFDTLQRLHVRGQRARTSRVMDNIIFQFITPEEPSGIVMRDRVGLDAPKHTLFGEGLEQLKAKELAQQAELTELQRRQDEEADRMRGRV